MDLNCYGSKDLYTPNIDGLAKRGLRFTQFYVASPVCSPSRASLLTGRNHNRAGVPNNVSSSADKPGMPTSEVTLAELLKPQGYRTALFGKWHLGTIPECDPIGQGFDEFFGFKAGCIDNYSHFFYWAGPHFHDLWRNRQEVWEDGTHLSDMLVRETLRFIDSNKERPFFIYLPINLPHYPKQAAQRFFAHYRDMPEPRRSYAATVSCIDDTVGKVLGKLDEHKLRENTLVIYFSDHGHSTEERTGFAGGNAGPYRGAKFSLLEGGIRVPCIVSMPGTIPEGEVRNQMVVSVDWYPTIAAVTGAKLPDRVLDGRNVMPILKSARAKTPHDSYNWMIGKQWAVREGGWKLVMNVNDTTDKDRRDQLPKVEPVFLSNIDEDVSETKNQADLHPEVVKRLTAIHDQWVSGLK